MSITSTVLGAPGDDNSLFVRIDSGQQVSRLLFDCGEGCPAALQNAEIMDLDHLFFSHLHLDHVAGFDHFFRLTYARTSKPNILWGPPGSHEILHHRIRGSMWNLGVGHPAVWTLVDIDDSNGGTLHTTRVKLSDAFSTEESLSPVRGWSHLVDTEDFVVDAILLDHGIPSVGYSVREKPRYGVEVPRLQASGLPAGPWIETIKRPPPGATEVVIDGVTHNIDRLRADLVVERAGDSVAYLTDFVVTPRTRDRLILFLAGCSTLYCESQYLESDRELAIRNYHLTARQAATIALEAGIGRLFLIHFSDRYRASGWELLLREARSAFPHSFFPNEWAEMNGA